MEKLNECKEEISDLVDTDNTLQECDIDTALLCPDVILDENSEANVIKNEHLTKHEIDGTAMNYNITGIKATFRLTAEEEIIRNEKYTLDNPVQNTRIHCTSCNTHLGSALSEHKNIFVHPLLNVIICKECFDFYTDGTFNKDQDGMELYCSWCGQGGEVFCCNKCPKVFCKLCIRLNFSFAKYAAVRDSVYWECFACNPVSMVSLKIQCYEFARYVRRELMRLENLQDTKFYMDIDYSQCCLTTKRQKRKNKSTDPDFVPYSNENCEKLYKKPKIEQTNHLENDTILVTSASTEFSSAKVEGTSVKVESSGQHEKTEEKWNLSNLHTNPSNPLPQLPETDPLAITVPTTSSSVSPTPIILHRYNLHNEFNFNKNTNLYNTKTIPIYLPVSKFTTLPGSSQSTTIPVSRVINTMSGPSQSTTLNTGPKPIYNMPQTRKLNISKAVVNYINSRHSSSVPGSQILFLRCPEEVPILPKPVSNKIVNDNQKASIRKINIEGGNNGTIQKQPSNPETLNYVASQLQSKMKKIDEQRAFFKKSSTLDRLLLSTALTNSSCATAMLGIYQFHDNLNSYEELTLVHDSLQKSLKTMTDSLIYIRNQLIDIKSPSIGQDKK